MNIIPPGYEVTPDGAVISMMRSKPRVLSQYVNANGYPSVKVFIDGKRTSIAVYRLVAAAHLPKRPSPLHEVRHLDGQKANSSATNLEWGTRKQNIHDAITHGTHSRGDKHSLATHLGIAKRKPRGAAGMLGVWKKRDKWAAEITVNGQKHRLGSFATAEEAHQAYKQAAAGHTNQQGVK